MKYYGNYESYKSFVKRTDMNNISFFGAIAQLVEHLHGMQGVSGSNPLGSITNLFQNYQYN